MSLNFSGKIGGALKLCLLLIKLYRTDMDASMINMVALVRRLNELARECLTRGTKTHTKTRMGISGIMLFSVY